MAGKAKGNMFAAAVQQRQQEQQEIEAAVTGAMVSGTTAGGRLEKRGRTRQHSTTVSDLLHKWIMENCTD